MIVWESTPANNSVRGLVTLLSRPDWSASPQGAQIRDAARGLLDHPDETTRMLAAPALAHLITDPAELRDEFARRLTSETHPGVRAQLIRVLDSALAGYPGHIDAVLDRLSGLPAWPMLSPAPEPAAATSDSAADDDDDYLIRILVALAVVHEQPSATGLLRTWLSAPASHRTRANRTCAWLRDYLNPGPGVSAGTVNRAFALLMIPLPEALAIWNEATDAGPATASTAGQQARLRAIVEVGNSIASDLYSASGAAPRGQGGGTPSTADFAARAFPVLEELAGLSHPAVVHRVAETLEQLADHDPQRAFLALAAAATVPHGYQWEHQGAELIMRIVDRYAADHRDLLLTQPECLSALRRLLEAFVRSGWDQAIQRVQDLSEFLY